MQTYFPGRTICLTYLKPVIVTVLFLVAFFKHTETTIDWRRAIYRILTIVHLKSPGASERVCEASPKIAYFQIVRYTPPFYNAPPVRHGLVQAFRSWQQQKLQRLLLVFLSNVQVIALNKCFSFSRRKVDRRAFGWRDKQLFSSFSLTVLRDSISNNYHSGPIPCSMWRTMHRVRSFRSVASADRSV